MPMQIRKTEKPLTALPASNNPWRKVATGLAFVEFGLMLLVVSIVASLLGIPIVSQLAGWVLLLIGFALCCSVPTRYCQPAARRALITLFASIGLEVTQVVVSHNCRNAGITVSFAVLLNAILATTTLVLILISLGKFTKFLKNLALVLNLGKVSKAISCFAWVYFTFAAISMIPVMAMLFEIMFLWKARPATLAHLFSVDTEQQFQIVMHIAWLSFWCLGLLVLVVVTDLVREKIPGIASK